MKGAFRSGIGFGLTSGVITTLGLIVGLNSGTASKEIIIAGVLTIAIADSLSDALGMHISQEAEIGNKKEYVWKSTFYTALFKALVAFSFLLPLYFLNLSFAFPLMLFWGMILLIGFSYTLAKWNKESPTKIIGEHLVVASIVLILTNYAGLLVRNLFL